MSKAEISRTKVKGSLIEQLALKGVTKDHISTWVVIIWSFLMWKMHCRQISRTVVSLPFWSFL